MYAPWCGHCKKLAPAWDELAGVLEDSVQVGKVDCTAHSDTCSRFDVKGYPTLIFLEGDSWYRYRGPRDITALAAFTANPEAEAEHAGKITKRLMGVEKIKKMGTGIAEEFSFSIKMLFEKIGMSHIDETLQIGIAISLFTLPLLMLCVLICFCGDEPVPEPKAPAKEAKDGKKGKAEKLD